MLQKFNYMRTHVLNSKRTLQLGRDVVSMEGKQEKYAVSRLLQLDLKKRFEECKRHLCLFLVRLGLDSQG